MVIKWTSYSLNWTGTFFKPNSAFILLIWYFNMKLCLSCLAPFHVYPPVFTTSELLQMSVKSNQQVSQIEWRALVKTSIPLSLQSYRYHKLGLLSCASLSSSSHLCADGRACKSKRSQRKSERHLLCDFKDAEQSQSSQHADPEGCAWFYGGPHNLEDTADYYLHAHTIQYSQRRWVQFSQQLLEV